MSGIEVVGVVLGALPLLIAAYQSRVKAKDAIGTITSFDQRYARAFEDIKDEQLFLQLGLKRMLQASVHEGILEDSDVQRFLDDPHVEIGRNAKVLECLERSLEPLGRARERYLELVGDIHEAILVLFEDVQFYEKDIEAYTLMNGQDPSRERLPRATRAYLRSAFRYRRSQLKFSLTTKSRDEALRNIQSKREKLESYMAFSNTRVVLGSNVLSMRAQRSRRLLLEYARHVGQIFWHLRACWKCACSERHRACLWLRHPESQTSEFKVVVIAGLECSSLGWQQHGILVSWSSQAMAGAARPAGRSAQDSGYLEATSKDIATARPEPTSDGGLCKALAKSLTGAPLIEGQKASDGQAEYTVHHNPAHTPFEGRMSLYQALDLKSSERLRQDRSTRFRLALKIASAQLQIHSAPWTTLQSSSTNICFPSNSDQDGCDIAESDPYLQGGFQAVSKDQATAPNRSERVFTALGITLLELVFGKLLEEHELWQQQAWTERRNDPFFRLLVARQWVDEAEQESGPQCAAALKWCITDSPVRLEGERWKGQLVDKVILPLERACEWTR